MKSLHLSAMIFIQNTFFFLKMKFSITEITKISMHGLAITVTDIGSKKYSVECDIEWNTSIYSNCEFSSIIFGSNR